MYTDMQTLGKVSNYWANARLNGNINLQPGSSDELTFTPPWNCRGDFQQKQPLIKPIALKGKLKEMLFRMGHLLDVINVSYVIMLTHSLIGQLKSFWGKTKWTNRHLCCECQYKRTNSAFSIVASGVLKNDCPAVSARRFPFLYLGICGETRSGDRSLCRMTREHFGRLWRSWGVSGAS